MSDEDRIFEIIDKCYRHFEEYSRRVSEECKRSMPQTSEEWEYVLFEVGQMEAVASRTVAMIARSRRKVWQICEESSESNLRINRKHYDNELKDLVSNCRHMSWSLVERDRMLQLIFKSTTGYLDQIGNFPRNVEREK